MALAALASAIVLAVPPAQHVPGVLSSHELHADAIHNADMLKLARALSTAGADGSAACQQKVDECQKLEDQQYEMSKCTIEAVKCIIGPVPDAEAGAAFEQSSGVEDSGSGSSSSSPPPPTPYNTVTAAWSKQHSIHGYALVPSLPHDSTDSLTQLRLLVKKAGKAGISGNCAPIASECDKSSEMSKSLQCLKNALHCLVGGATPYGTVNAAWSKHHSINGYARI